MTVICWDGKTLAADKRATSGGGIARTVTKIQRHRGTLLAITGDWDCGMEMVAWWKAGAKPAEFPPAARGEGGATLITISRKTGIATYGTGPYAFPIEAEQCAFGSGRDYAEAAMHLGHDARRGVEVACHFQTDCGNGIDTLELA